MPSPKSPHEIIFLVSDLSINKVPLQVSKEVDEFGCPLEEEKKGVLEWRYLHVLNNRVMCKVPKLGPLDPSFARYEGQNEKVRMETVKKKKNKKGGRGDQTMFLT